MGWWALVPVEACLLWTWINPRLFAQPSRTEGWAVEGTFGERLFMEQPAGDVSAHHRRAVAILTAANVARAVLLGHGLVVLDPTITLWGLTTTMGAKIWTFDRMASARTTCRLGRRPTCVERLKSDLATSWRLGFGGGDD